MEFKYILFEKEGGIATITLNRPEVMNALNWGIWGELKDALDRAVGDSNVRVIVLTGAGRAFSAGVDIKSMAQNTDAEQEGYLKLEYGMFDYIEKVPKPIICAINGYALGNAFELALACDIRIAAESAKFGMPEAFLGLIAPVQRITRIVGIAKAKEILFTGKYVDAFEAERIGIVSKTVKDAELKATSTEMANKIIATFSPLALKYTKMAIHLGMPYVEAAFKFENQSAMICHLGEDAKEGAAAFKEKRSPKFKGIAEINPFYSREE